MSYSTSMKNLSVSSPRPLANWRWNVIFVRIWAEYVDAQQKRCSRIGPGEPFNVQIARKNYHSKQLYLRYLGPVEKT
jgi:hypothetical protein